MVSHQHSPMPSRYWTRVCILGMSIVLLALFITIWLSHLETKRRLHIIEYQHQLIVREMSENSGKNLHLTMEAIRRQRHLKDHVHNLPSLRIYNKIIAELEHLKRHTNGESNERIDFALANAGAKIVSIGKTKALTPLPNWMTTIFGFGHISKYFINGAQHVIQPSIYPGECFAFTGAGEITIKLIGDVFIDAVSIEHILPNMSPDGHIKSAPHEFNVYGMQTEYDTNTIELGTFFYDTEKNQSLQEFPINSMEKSFPIVKFTFAPNRSDVNHTCVYRVQVHGSLIKTDPKKF